LTAPAVPNTSIAMNIDIFKKPYAIIVATISGVVLMSFGLSDDLSNALQANMKYDGTYSLYVSYESGMTISWITNIEQSGKVILKDENGNLLEEATTEPSRVHSFSLEKKPKKNIKLEFGGDQSGMESVHIRQKITREKGVFRGVDSIFAIGDVHGYYDEMIKLLINSKVIDENLNWVAGRAHLVFLGDLFDRGSDVTKVLWFIHELEPKALKQGGKVHIVLGNHEIMTSTSDLRFLSIKERNLSIAYKTGYDKMYHPTRSYLGNWLISKPSVLKIDGLLMAHGGIVDLGTPNIEEFNDQVNSYMNEEMYLEITKDHADSAAYDAGRWYRMKQFFYSDLSPYWYRGYVLSDTLEKQLDNMLRKYKSKVHLVGHTPQPTITSRYDGKLITTDLEKKATELVLMIRKKKKYTRYKIDSEGLMTEL
jgi:hypothetical protein